MLRRTKVENHIHNHNYNIQGMPSRAMFSGGIETDDNDSGNGDLIAKWLFIGLFGLGAIAVIMSVLAWLFRIIGDACLLIMSALADIAPVAIGVTSALVIWFFLRRYLKRSFVPMQDETTLYPGQYEELPHKALQARKSQLKQAEHQRYQHNKTYELEARK